MRRASCLAMTDKKPLPGDEELDVQGLIGLLLCGYGLLTVTVPWRVFVPMLGQVLPIWSGPVALVVGLVLSAGARRSGSSLGRIGLLLGGLAALLVVAALAFMAYIDAA